MLKTFCLLALLSPLPRAHNHLGLDCSKCCRSIWLCRESGEKQKKNKTKTKAFPQIQVTEAILQLVLRTNPTLPCLKAASTPHAGVGRCPYLLYDILSRAEAWSFDHSAWLLWGDIMYLNKETVILRADGCFFLCFLKDVSLI